MTKKEVWTILRLIESVYSFFITRDETVTNWFKTCEEMDYEMVMANLLHHVKRKVTAMGGSTFSFIRDILIVKYKI